MVASADGWYAPSDSLDELAGQLHELRQLADAVGRPFESIDITINWRLGKHPDALPAYEELGVTRAVVMLPSTGERDPRKAVDLIATAALLG